MRYVSCIIRNTPSLYLYIIIKIFRKLSTKLITMFCCVSSIVWSYLICREQVVHYEEYYLDGFTPTSGDLQDSNLEPLLLLILINALPSVMDTLKLLFVDDLKTTSVVHTEQNAWILQQQLDKESNWCTAHRLSLNILKCKVMTYGGKIALVAFDYKINDTILLRCNTNKDLRIVFDPTPSSNDHIDGAVRTTSKMYGFRASNTKSFQNVSILECCVFVKCQVSVLEYIYDSGVGSSSEKIS